MMKKILFVLCSVLTLMSCEKVDLSEYGVTTKSNLTVRVFEIGYTPFDDVNRASVADACNHLNFALYDADGARVKQVNQQLGDDDYGTASFQIADGRYFLVVVGHSSNGNPTMTDATKIQFTNGNGYSDTFLYAVNVEVGGKPVELDVSLERIVSLCRFVITDDIPANVSKMRFYYTGGSGAFDATTGLGCVNSKQQVTFDVSATQKQFDLYTFLHEKEGNIELKVTALDASDNELFERNFNVPLVLNQITWLSGAFFDDPVSSSSIAAKINVDTEWDDERHLTF